MISVFNKIDYDVFPKNYPWLFEKNLNCIISPDIDGILCALLTSHYLKWKVVGYYDGKNLLIEKDKDVYSCVFLDMEIFRKNIKSVGQHMLLYNKKSIPGNWDNFTNCINPNLIRNYDAYNDFSKKYPFGTIHLLMSIYHSNNIKIEILKDAITILLYVDGTFKNLLNYPENCIDWLDFLNAKDKNHPLSELLNIFAFQKIASIMHTLKDMFQKFKEINDNKKGGDKIILNNYSNDSFEEKYQYKLQELIKFVSNLTGWSINNNPLVFNNLIIHSFEKGIEEKLNNKNFENIIHHNPISFAITATKRIEFTKYHLLFNQ